MPHWQLYFHKNLGITVVAHATTQKSLWCVNYNAQIPLVCNVVGGTPQYFKDRSIYKASVAKQMWSSPISVVCQHRELCHIVQVAVNSGTYRRGYHNLDHSNTEKDTIHREVASLYPESMRKTGPCLPQTMREDRGHSIPGDSGSVSLTSDRVPPVIIL